MEDADSCERFMESFGLPDDDPAGAHDADADAFFAPAAHAGPPPPGLRWGAQ